MGTCISYAKSVIHRRQDDLEREKKAQLLTKNIEKELMKMSKKDENLTRLLLLGSGNSGKSTILKQFKIFIKLGNFLN